MQNEAPVSGAESEPGRLPGMVRLWDVMRQLRGPGGCPWDREQSLATLKSCLLEECYELLAAMEGEDLEAHAEELGDVLLQVVFQAVIREEQGAFTLDDVAWRLVEKLERRHPHVFGTTAVDNAEAVLRNWEQIKQAERAAAPPAARSALAGVPAALPALLQAQRVQSKASRVGFDWPEAAGPRAKIDEELAELEQAVAAGDQAAMTAEMGDLLFSLVNLCRFLKIDAEEALRGSTGRFSNRFQWIEAALAAGDRQMRDCTLAELDALWERAKAAGC